MNTVSKENSEHYIWGDVCAGWHLLNSNGLSVIEEEVPPGGAETLHYHEKSHQFFYVLFGEATMELGQEQVVLRAHQGLSIPPLTPHRLANYGNETLSFLVVSAPRSHGDRVIIQG